MSSVKIWRKHKNLHYEFTNWKFALYFVPKHLLFLIKLESFWKYSRCWWWILWDLFKEWIFPYVPGCYFLLSEIKTENWWIETQNRTTALISFLVTPSSLNLFLLKLYFLFSPLCDWWNCTQIVIQLN